MSLADNFRRNVRERRTAQRLSQDVLGEISGYSVSHIAATERGERPNPGLAFMEAMAGALGCTVFDLLEEAQ